MSVRIILMDEAGIIMTECANNNDEQRPLTSFATLGG